MLLGRSEKWVGLCIWWLVIDMNMGECEMLNKGWGYWGDNGGVGGVGIK